jgi:hypothetical protein
MADLTPSLEVLAMAAHARDALATAGEGWTYMNRLHLPHPTFPALAPNAYLPLFSSTSFQADYNSLVFINIVSSPKSDIFSICFQQHPFTILPFLHSFFIPDPAHR